WTTRSSGSVPKSVPDSVPEALLQIAGELVEHPGQLLPALALDRVAGDGDARGVAVGVQRDRAEIGVLDRPAVNLHGCHGHAERGWGALPRDHERGHVALRAGEGLDGSGHRRGRRIGDETG